MADDLLTQLAGVKTNAIDILPKKQTESKLLD